MKGHPHILFLLLLLSYVASWAADASYKYRVWLTDKGNNEYSIEHPEEFLSTQCIERRTQQGIAIDSLDLPVSKHYIEQIAATGCNIEITSRWMNTIVVSLNDTTIIHDIVALPFVAHTQCVWKNNLATKGQKRNKQAKQKAISTSISTTDNSALYNHTWQQTQLLNLDSLHLLGYRGQGMRIAVLDAGFYGAENSSYISPDKIVGRHNFTPGSNFNDTHGTEVLSCMAAYVEGEYIGSAPDATYWLITTEDLESEYPIEEDYWAAGAEMADSVGAHIINSSLAYNTFDDPTMNYTHNDLDGETGFCSRAATIAAHKGILVVIAAGNEYSRAWQKIGVPADAKDCLTVGSVDASGTHSHFSSCGYTADNRIKPDIMSMGSNASCITANDKIKVGSGTSYASPIVCGALACLWQAHPEWSVAELIERVQRSSSQYNHPNAIYGYGIPNLYAVHLGASHIESVTTNEASIYVHDGILHLPSQPIQAVITLYDPTGREIWHTPIEAHTSSVALPHIQHGCYIATLQLHDTWVTHKLYIH